MTLYAAPVCRPPAYCPAAGRAFREFKALDAYRWDIIGSILGTLAFTLISFLRAPSWVWPIVALVALILLFGKKLPIASIIAMVLVIGALVVEALAQIGCILAYASDPFDQQTSLMYFLGIDRTKFRQPVRPGDVLHTRQVLQSVSEPKTTKLGTGRFWIIDVEYLNQRDELVGVETYTGFGYRRGAA